jgi:PPOX class probable F420-dependent enzyme
MPDDHEPASTTPSPKTLMADISQRLALLRPYLVETRCAVLTTLDPDGSPHPAVVHYRLEDDAIVINGRVDRRWVRNLRRDPRVSVVIHDADDLLHWVGIKGATQLLREVLPLSRMPWRSRDATTRIPPATGTRNGSASASFRDTSTNTRAESRGCIDVTSAN